MRGVRTVLREEERVIRREREEERAIRRERERDSESNT